jgi:CHAT domain-containing protein
VYIAPDLSLCRVPWAALPGSRPNTILLEDYALATIPHAVFLLDKLWPQPLPRYQPREVLAVGGVAFDADPPAASAVPLLRGDPLFRAGQMPVWKPLPGTASEVKGVDAVAKKNHGTRLLLGDKATPSAVLSALAEARHAHLATHGFFAD